MLSSLTPATLGALGVAVSMSTLASTTVELLAWLRPGAIARDTRVAVHVWWPIIAAGSVLVAGGPWAATVLMLFVSLQLVHEFSRLVLPEEPGLRLAMLLVVPLHYALVPTGEVGPLFAGVVGWCLVVLPLVRMFGGGPVGFTTAVSRAQWGVLAMVLGASHVAWLAFRHEGAVAFVLAATFAGDAMQWSWGKSLGRMPLAPRVSPKKTWEGLVGGTVTVALVFAAAGPYMLDVTPLEAGLLAGGLVPVGLLGDLVMSAIKRDIGVKDAGALIPGQGGLLDRFDGLLFTAPVFAHLLTWVL